MKSLLCDKIVFFGLTLCTIVFFSSNLSAQKSIKIQGKEFNLLDKKGKKYGEWIFYDINGYIRLTTKYINNQIVEPLFFYENSDTAFIRFPKKDNAELFIFYDHNTPISGSFVYTNDGKYEIEIDSNYVNNTNVLSQIKAYKEVEIPPLYMFGQKKLVDYISAQYNGLNISFNKSIYALLHINNSGKIDRVDFPIDKNNLSQNEQHELEKIYLSVPRWQPFFKGNSTQECTVSTSRKSTLSRMGE